MSHSENYEVRLGERAQKYWEKLADDGTEEQLNAFQDAIKYVAENPYSGNPVVTDPGKKRSLVSKLYAGPIKDSYTIDGSTTNDDETRQSMVFEFPNGYEIEMFNPRVALNPKYKKNFGKDGLRMSNTFIGGQIKDIRIGSLDQVFVRVQRHKQTITLASAEWNLSAPYLDLILNGAPSR